MATVALTVISSVVVTNIYQNNISSRVRSLLLRRKRKTETREIDSPDGEDYDGIKEPKQNETIEQYCKELSLRVDRGLFYIWSIIYISCSTICVFLISLH